MKVSELRIGNWLIYSPDETWSEVIEVLESDFHYSVYKDFEPIPLTEEWLKRFGFEKDATDWWYIGESIGLKRYNDETFKAYVPNVDVKHVHQLQNLYFALTGEELELKEQK